MRIRALLVAVVLACVACDGMGAVPLLPRPSPTPVTSPSPVAVEVQTIETAVANFMAARVAGDAQAAATYLTAAGFQQFAEHAIGVRLVDPAFSGWEMGSVEPLFGGGSQVIVRVELADGGEIFELLFVGSGRDTQGHEQPFVIRGARLL